MTSKNSIGKYFEFLKEPPTYSQTVEIVTQYGEVVQVFYDQIRKAVYYDCKWIIPVRWRPAVKTKMEIYYDRLSHK